MKLGVNIGGINKHRYYRRERQLEPFDGLVQPIAVGNINECSAAMERRKGCDFVLLPLRAKQQA
jgi:hypothetical protein